MKVLYVGSSDMGVSERGYEVVKHVDVEFPLYGEDADALLRRIFREARDADAEGVIFQDIPPQMVYALTNAARRNGGNNPMRVGAIVLCSGQYQALRQEYRFSSVQDAREAAIAVRLANPRASTKVRGTRLLVYLEKPQWSHIEWVL